jgi:hypothetical protein
LSSSGDDTDALIRALPNWIFNRQLRSIQGLTTFIISAVATWFVASIFGLWRAVLGFVTSLYNTAAWAVWSIGNTIGGVLSNAWLIVEAIDWVALQIESVILQLGLFAPIATSIAWIIVMVMLAILVNAGLRALGTYLPLGSLPFIGGWFT